jgi:hypothetical protein
MWTEEEIQKDATEIQSSIHALARDYNAQSTRSMRSRVTENKENTTGFFNNFYETLRKAEYDIYRQFAAMSEPDTNISKYLTHEFTEIKNSANDLPHPRILSELQRDYDKRIGRHHTTDADSENNRYIPYKVYSYIREKSEYCIRFKADINGRVVSLYFITFPESHIAICSKIGSSSSSLPSSYLCAAEIAVYQLYAYKVFIWISMVGRMANKECSEKLDVYFYMTPFKKERPHHNGGGEDNLSAIHVNTGLTRNCETHGEIIVYRAEEWFKVFIHESMHNFNMDFIDLDLHEANERLRTTFCIPHGDILLFESYTEAWARIITIMIDTYFHKETQEHAHSTDTRTHFIRTVREKLANNALFHTYQAVKVLDIMNLKYSEITVLTDENMAVCRKRYKEDTNVYAYYILGGILSAYALPFVCWCCDNNKGRGHVRDGIQAIRFSRSNENLNRFVDFICRAARDPVLLNMISFIETSSSSSSRSTKTSSVLKKTMRMTPE